MAWTPQTPGSGSAAAGEVRLTPPPSRQSKWGISLAVILGSLTTSVMGGTVNVALPTMMTSLRAEVHQIQWVLTAFMITRTVIMPTLGWVGGWLGNRRLYLGCLTLFLLGSMLCGLAWNIQSMVAFRIIQALGAGYLFPLAMTILHETFPPHERGMAMGIFMAGLSMGPAIGPWAGGYLIEHLSWRAIFYINLPIGLVALLVAAAMLPSGGRRERGTVDVLGLLTMGVFIVSLLLAVSQARDYGWGDPYILTLLTVAGLSLVAFIAAELTTLAPLVNLRLYTNFQFGLASLVTFFNAFSNFGVNFILTLFLQRGLGYTPQQAGEIRLPSALMWGATSLCSGRLTDRIDGRWLILSGSLILVVVFGLFASINVWSGSGAIILLLMIRSLARGFIQPPIVTIVMASLPEDQVRMGAGLRGLLNSLGSTFGVAFAGFWLQQRLAVQTYTLRENQQLDGFDVRQLTEAVRLELLRAGEVGVELQVKTQALMNRWLVDEAAALSYQEMFIMTALIVLLAAVPVWWLRHRRAA
jgi:DHA2 family multidrug resistance protein